MLKLAIGVFFKVVALDFIGVDGVAGKAFSVPESQSPIKWRFVAFLATGAISFSKSFLILN